MLIGVSILLLLLLLVLSGGEAFVVPPSSLQPTKLPPQPTKPQPTKPPTTTTLQLLVDVPTDGPFFSLTFPVLGILASIARQYSRVRMEERAWERRLQEHYEHSHPDATIVSELQWRQRIAAQQYSVYGPQQQQQQQPGRRVQVTEPATKTQQQQQYDQFERDHGVPYDPYYDAPYTKDELPSIDNNNQKYKVDKLYGDILYDNGEIFYKDSESGLYYRQGCVPRLSFFASPKQNV